jgi:hypothetical protein
MPRPLANVVMCAVTLPDDLIHKELWSKHGVHQNFEVVACGGIAVEINGAGFLEDAAEFDEAGGHHGEVGHHVGVEEEGFEGAEGVGDAASLLDDLLVGALGVDVPLPGVFKGVNLGAGLGAVFFGEEDVVVLAGVEGRIEIDKIDGLVLDVELEDFEVVAVIEPIFERVHGIGLRVTQGGGWGAGLRAAGKGLILRGKTRKAYLRG